MNNRICEILGIEKPIIQAPMVWLTDAKLCAAACNAGGMGSLGPNAGQTTVTRDPVETAERMREEIRKVRELTDKPFNVNILPPYGDTEDIFTPPMLKVIYEEKVPVVTYVGGIRPELFAELKEHGITNVMLTKSLKELEESGLISRKQYSEIPPKVEYSLTDRGSALIPALNALYEWGEEQMKLNLSEE